MSVLLATTSLALFTPVLVASSLALGVLILGRVVASRSVSRAIERNRSWAPSIPSTGANFPLNSVDPRPPANAALSAVDSAAQTLEELRIELSDISFIDLSGVDVSLAHVSLGS